MSPWASPRQRQPPPTSSDKKQTEQTEQMVSRRPRVLHAARTSHCSHGSHAAPVLLRCPDSVKLDFEARVPVPFSVFPSAYRESETATQTAQATHTEVEIKVPEKAGRKGQASSIEVHAHLPPPPPPAPAPQPEVHAKEEVTEVKVTREEEKHHRPGIQEAHAIHEEFHEHHRPQSSHTHTHTHTHTETRVEVDRQSHIGSAIDVAESEYRARFQPNYRKDFSVTGTTVDGTEFKSATHKASSSHVEGTTVELTKFPTFPKDPKSVVEFTVDAPSTQKVHKETTVTVADSTTVDPPRPPKKPQLKADLIEETVETSSRVSSKKSKMGYFDEQGRYHSFRDGLQKGLHKLADKIAHPEGHAAGVELGEPRRAPAPGEAPRPPNTVTIPCHHIRLGDILILQGRPCQVIRISTSAATGQHRYLGVDLFTKQLHEESSFVSNPAPSVVVQTMLGPVFKQYRVLDMRDDGTIVAMTETGDVKQNLPVIDQSNLWGRLKKAFESGRGSVRVLVVSDHGREMAVDMKVVHGSRL
ncbi:putative woronin body protein [Thermochaetoides thermophila DSM 1495]|uniref:Putative woronin body protein n=1 Tax=Chaetomium thermophilum (strain DSM 1495 / CBS 144.50 / IMI 039719) TaxID=759272 RepID=G0S1L2_CHATD|nr:putative woronin body protein [Thermochaetoides thermophila DSM 1495]EGS22922.1 putative woronin body protein [Thermochaetoides thermophila DSM 1495]